MGQEEVSHSDDHEKVAAPVHAETGLDPVHRDYLLQRHGTIELDPIPSNDPADPYNWPKWKKVTNLILVAFHALMATFSASSIIPAYADIAADLGISLEQSTYLTSMQIAVVGGAPLFWKPLANRYGRRPIFLISLLGSLVCNVGCAKSSTYASLSACRVLMAFFICPAGAIGSAVVTECFFKHERAKYMGVWTLLVTLGVPLSPFLFGFVTQRVGYHWIFWILAMINGGQFILYIFFGPETRYVGRTDRPKASTFCAEYFHFGRIDPTPLTAYEFVQPLTMVKRASVIIPAAAYAMIFLFANVMNTVEIPSLLQRKFGLDAQQLGLQFLSLIIGSVLGEQVGGPLSDLWMKRKARQSATRPSPEYRLWLSYFGYVVTIVGMVVFLVQTQHAKEGKWNITPLVGVALAAFGNQLVTTVVVTYAVDSNPTESGSVGVFMTLVRQIWGFIGPFWFPDMFDNVGVAKSAGIIAALIVAVSIIPTALLQWRGNIWKRGAPDMV